VIKCGKLLEFIMLLDQRKIVKTLSQPRENN